MQIPPGMDTEISEKETVWANTGVPGARFQGTGKTEGKGLRGWVVVVGYVQFSKLACVPPRSQLVTVAICLFRLNYRMGSGFGKIVQNITDAQEARDQRTTASNLGCYLDRYIYPN